LEQKQIEAWRNRPIEGKHPYVYLDGIVLKRSWAGKPTSSPTGWNNAN
jgi:transposase-like protein